MTTERLQKIMAHAGIASRRECEKMIEAGQVKVNGRTAKLGDKADPAVDKIVVRGTPLNPQAQKPVYIALNKPKGVLSSTEDELGAGRKTVRDLIPLPGRLYPVGRLDKQSEGLILMTNDGDLAHKLTHPRYGHKKTYRVTLEGRLDQESLQKWRKGVYLDGRKTAPAQIAILQQDQNFTLLEIVMREGRKRQIRRIASMLGYPVKQLVREKIGPLSLGRLRSGDWRYLTASEVKILRETVSKGGKRAGRKKKRKKK